MGTQICKRNFIVLKISRFIKFQLDYTPHNLRPMLIDLAEQLFLSQPFAAVSKMNCDVYTRHSKFWSSIEVKCLYDIYSSIGASPSKVLKKLVEPAFFANAHEQ